MSKLKKTFNSSELETPARELEMFGNIYNEYLSKISNDVKTCEELLKKYPLTYFEYVTQAFNEDGYGGFLVYSNGRICLKLFNSGTSDTKFKLFQDLTLEDKIKFFLLIPNFINEAIINLKKKINQFDFIKNELNESENKT